jgi:hypothetical protein
LRRVDLLGDGRSQAVPSDQAMTSEGIASILDVGLEIGGLSGRLVALHTAG